LITRHHLTLALLCTLILAIAGVPGTPWLAGVAIAGAVLGSVLPDIHMKRPSRLRLLTVAWCITRFSERACMPVLKLLSKRCLDLPIADGDKRAAHSLAGLVFTIATIAVLVYIPVILVPGPVSPVLAGTFLSGVLIGLVLHLIADMCTKKGITPFFPFSTVQVSGTIRPCNPDDWRIAGYHAGLCIVLVVLVTLTGNGGYPAPAGMMVVIPGLAACICAMLCCSQVRVTKDESGSGTGTEVPGAVT
jgi:membrane-bound metal-dependent hydrolase YbcI (DUF457 family)